MRWDWSRASRICCKVAANLLFWGGGKLWIHFCYWRKKTSVASYPQFGGKKGWKRDANARGNKHGTDSPHTEDLLLITLASKPLCVHYVGCFLFHYVLLLWFLSHHYIVFFFFWCKQLAVDFIMHWFNINCLHLLGDTVAVNAVAS